MKYVLRLLAAGFVGLFASQAMAANLLYISEYSAIGNTTGYPTQIAQEPVVTDQQVDFTAGATKSAAFNAATAYVRVWCNVQCSIKFGTDAALTSTPATNANKPLAATSPEYFAVPIGKANKISVIANP